MNAKDLGTFPSIMVQQSDSSVHSYLRCVSLIHHKSLSLNLENVQTVNQHLSCSFCGSKLFALSQIYKPYSSIFHKEHYPLPWHRYIFREMLEVVETPLRKRTISLRIRRKERINDWSCCRLWLWMKAVTRDVVDAVQAHVTEQK